MKTSFRFQAQRSRDAAGPWTRRAWLLATALGVGAHALRPSLAEAQVPPAAEPERAFAAAQAEYEVGHYAAAFAAFAAGADAGHGESARIALQMQRHGPSLYGMRFAAGPKQIARWTALVARNCRKPGDACGCASTQCSAARAGQRSGKADPCPT